MASPVRRLLFAAVLVCAGVAGAGWSDPLAHWAGFGTTHGAAVAAGPTGVDAVEPARAGGVLTLVTGRSPVTTAEPADFSVPRVVPVVGLALALFLLGAVGGAPAVRLGPVRRRGPPSPLFAKA